eukprot:4628604-Pleurochrysis_carterae.AAC.1
MSAMRSETGIAFGVSTSISPDNKAWWTLEPSGKRQARCTLGRRSEGEGSIENFVFCCNSRSHSLPQGSTSLTWVLKRWCRPGLFKRRYLDVESVPFECAPFGLA